MPCHDPCLDPCDRRNDCCCEQLALKSTVQRGSVPGLASCIAIQSLTLSWKTPLPECVLARAGVDTAAEVTIEAYLAGVGETPDATAAGDAGEIVFTREELFGSGEPCGACLSDLSLDMWLVVRNGDGDEVMRCPVCPASCDEGSPSVSPSPGCSCLVEVVASGTPCDPYTFESFVSVSVAITLTGECDYPLGKVKMAVTGVHDPIPDDDGGPDGDGVYRHSWSGTVGCVPDVPLIVLVWFEGFPGQNLLAACGETTVELPMS